ncbi:MAG TPA: hypothetical protein VFM18_18265 [Methanosarcina sp.]|nr:hypothetical protein [Methanosarcina sp.]
MKNLKHDMLNNVKFWKAVATARKDFDEQYVEDDFYKYVELRHGIKLYRATDGNVALHYDIVDEQKYLLFTLKYE